MTPVAAAATTTPPASLLTRLDKSRQRRVSSVSSSHSIRQVGTYGSNRTVSPSKIMSPARKANPYYSSVLARFSDNGKHSLPERDLSSGKRRSLVSVGGERARVGAEATISKEKLNTIESEQRQTSIEVRQHSVASTRSSIGSDLKEHGAASASHSNQKTEEELSKGQNATPLANDTQVIAPAPIPVPLLFSATYEEEYDIEKDESARNSTRGSPFATRNGTPMAGNSPSSNRRPLPNIQPKTPTMSHSIIYPVETVEPTTQEHVEDQSNQDQLLDQLNTSSTTTTWPTAAGISFGAGTIPDTASSVLPSTASHTADAEATSDSEADADDDITPSCSTISSAQVIQGFRDQGIITTEENWDDSSSQQDNVPPIVLVQRPSMDASVRPDQSQYTQSSQPLSSIVSSVMSASSQKLPPPQPKRFASMGQWSESSYDPCAPLRWDELFEMDPNSKGPLWLSNRGLGQIPHEFFDGLRNLRELYLDHNDIKIVPDSLLKLSKLDVLDLSNNSISSFHAAFKLKKLKNLKRLNLDNNLLTDISPIYKLKALRELRMNHNFVPYLAIAIQNMAKLKILAMESNSLAALPESMSKLGNLCELRLSDNNLRTLPDSIGAIRTLQVLALRSNLLETLPESWKDMENLSTLDLACNRLTALPADLVRLPKLTHLDLHDNQIQALPDKIGQLSNLVVLQLCNNHLRELPKDIGRLRDLHDLVLSFNQLQYLPDEIGKLNKLQELKFDNNPLRSLPKTIQRLTNVRRVHLQGCELRDLPVELGTAFKELIYLDLSGNQFEVMPALNHMTKLEEFYISNNYLREIGTSSLNLQSSNNSTNSYSSGTMSVGSGAGLISSASTGHGSSSQGGLNAGTGTIQGGVTNSSASQTVAAGTAMMGGGVTASKLSDLKRLRVFEAHHNQIRVLSPKIKLLPQLEVLDLGYNLLAWLPKEVGDLADLKVLILEGNPIKSLPSSLTKLMGTLEVFRVGEWPENGFEITRVRNFLFDSLSTCINWVAYAVTYKLSDLFYVVDEQEQAPMNMKINVLQSIMPQQIERTLLMRMHDSILKRVQELDSQQYRDQHDSDNNNGSGSISRAITATPSRAPGTTFALASSAMSTLQQTRAGSVPHEGGLKSHIGATPGLAIATQNMMANRSFALPPISSSTEGLASATTPTSATRPTSMEQPKYSGLLTVNSEGINPNYVEYPSSTVRTLPTPQFSSLRGLSSPTISSPITTSPQSITSPSGPLSNFPLLNSLRPRKSHQQLTAGKGSNPAATARPKTMYVYAQESQQQEHSQATSTVRSNRRLSRVFDFASGNKQKHETSDSKVSTLESSRLQLSTDAMMALGLGTQLGSAGSMTAHNNGYDRLGYGLNQTGSGLGDGSLASIKSSLAIKSSPSLTSVTLPSFTSGAGQLSTGSTAAGAAGTSGTSLPRIKTSFARSFSPLPNHVTESLRRSSVSSATERTGQNTNKSTSALPWLRLKSPAMSFNASQDYANQSQSDYPPLSASIVSITASMSASPLLQQPAVHGLSITGPTPPPILLDYNLDSSSLDIPSHLYYSAGGDDVDGDHPNEDGDGLGIDGETEEDDDRSTTTGGDELRQRNSNHVKGKARDVEPETQKSSQELTWQQELYHQQQQQQKQQLQLQQLNAADPVLKIAVLKGIYDQILHNMDQLVEQEVQESPAKKNNKFKLLNTLRFLKADRSGSNGSHGGAGYYHQHQQQQQQQQHHGPLTSPVTGLYPMPTMMQ
ncbi:hypothetical protein BGZ51_004416 [Haplosporangium sp. Z 767]|nr:hypothetical protein BGZ50_001767 [Haplosporangium sp. Z 11]KAF9192961.1 hypothetical protein BGZ51_004416 [Haplosporangium sp. Z 767]